MEKDKEYIEKRFSWVKRSRTFKNIVRRFNLSNKKVLDIGCGDGHYLTHFGKGSVGVTTSLIEVEGSNNKNINIVLGNAEEIEKIDMKKDFDVIWANNLFEHLLSPHAFLMKLKNFSHSDTILILGVPVVPFPSVLSRLPKFRGSLASPHINFFTKKTLQHTIERAGWEILETRSFFFKLSLVDWCASVFMPHIYIVAKNKKDFLYPTKKVMEWKDMEYYRDILAITGQEENK
ncbi:MAG: class I SAM-dependent methyltransferase [Candidatus Pacebacteria bacterium]|nr:class I SAM-dependent methyltransferase [Candidatus Paceibacterota bacterium]